MLSAAEELHAHLGASGGGASAVDGAGSRRLVDEILRVDERLQQSVGEAFEAHDRRQRAAALARRASSKQAALVALAGRMHAAEVRLGETIQASREALATADAAQARASTATIVEYAERVSYSNAAPCGAVAFEGARRQGWFQGWGAPAPQQHMIARARFAPGGAQAAASEAAPAGAATDAAAAAAQPASASSGSAAEAPPTFTATANAAAAGEKRNHVSLELNSGSEDEDDDFY